MRGSLTVLDVALHQVQLAVQPSERPGKSLPQQTARSRKEEN